MKKTILAILISLPVLLSCSTKTIVKIKPVEIPSKYLKCEPRESNFKPSDEAYKGDLKQYIIDLSRYSLNLESQYDKCVKNAQDAVRYQKQIVEEGS